MQIIKRTHFSLIILVGIVVFLIFGYVYSKFDVSPLSYTTDATTQTTLARETTRGDEVSSSTIKVVERPISSDDTFYTVLEELDVQKEDARTIFDAAQDIYDFNKIQVGRVLRVVFAEKVLAAVEYPLDEENLLVIERSVDGFLAKTEPISYDVTTRVVKVPITGIFYLDALDQGVSDNTIMNLVDLYSWDIDFAADVAQGDWIDMVYEQRSLNGVSAGDGNIIAARARLGDTDYWAFLFGEGDERAYYDESGIALARSFLRTPLAFGAITSGYSQSRVNPVTRVVQPHRALDYGAPEGTPVYATADGTVSLAGWKDNAYGKSVEITHANGYKSQYAHLSKVAAELKRDSQVTQGEIIGYVGSTGISTGPHLQYALFQNGAPVNPLGDDLPKGKILESSRISDFNSVRDELRAVLENI